MAFNPMVQDRSGEILAQGMSGLGQGIGQGLAGLGQMLAKQKQLVQNAKIAESAVKANPDLLKALGITQDQFSAMSALDKTTKFAGAVQGIMNQRDAQRAKAQEDYEAARSGLLKQQAEGYDQQQQQRAAMPGFLADIQRYMGGQPSGDAIRNWMEDSPAGTPMPQGGPKMELIDAFLKAGSQSGAVTPDMLDKMLMGEERKKAPLGDPRYWKSPGGKGFALYGNEMQAADKEEPADVPNEAWVYGEDEKEFQKRLLQIPDRRSRDAIIATRQHYRASTREPVDPNAFFKAMGIGGGATNQPTAKGSLYDRFKNFKP